jgi:hypothetical protein
MDGWLAVAEKLFGGRSQPPPPFELTCACGRIVMGERTRAIQTVTCAACGAALFVLPASVYPPPAAPRRKVLAGPASRPPMEAAATEAPEPDAAPNNLPPKVLKTAAAKPAVEAPASGNAAGIPATRRSVQQIVGASPLTLRLDHLRRRVFSPVKLVLSGVVGVIALTGWWIAHLRSLEEAEKTVVSAARLGEQALQERDLSEAARQYKKVRSSLDLLGRGDPQARALRQTAAETSAAADLSRASLFEILREASGSAAGRTHLTWDEIFKTSYKDAWVVVDAQVSRAADPASGRRYDVDFPVIDGRNRGVLVADLEIFDKALSAGGGPQRVIFAAQLDDIRPVSPIEDTWQIVLRPGTGFLWSSAENLERLGFAVDELTAQLLSDQTRHLGIPQ